VSFNGDPCIQFPLRRGRHFRVGYKVVIDRNAVPPLGIEGVEVTDRGKERGGVIACGAIDVGETKMKLHKAAVARLFEGNDLAPDAEQVYAPGEGL
jgi:hypothetical protein